MTIFARLRSWLQATLQRSEMEREMEGEFRAHMESRVEDLVRDGMSLDDARRRARLEFGSLDQTKEACRDARGAGLLESLLWDIGFGSRMLRKNPGFSALAVLTLALGIGATTAVFSVVNGVLLRDLPYRDPSRLVFLWEPVLRIPNVPLEAWGPINADFYDWQSQSRSFTNMALFTTERFNLSVADSAVRINGSHVTGDFFNVLGVSPQLGRAVDSDDDQAGTEQVAVISHALWQSRFGGDRSVLGRQLLLDAKSYRIIGVMPAGFAFPHGSESIETTNAATDVWLAWAMSPKEKAVRDNDPGTAIARLRSGVSLAQAQAEMSAITARLDPLHLEPFFKGAVSVIRPLDVTVTGSSRRALLIFMAAVFGVLLIACTNVASLVLSRANSRALEMSLRTALGASRARLIRQLLVESFCLAAAAGILGALAAFVAIRMLVHLNPANIPRIDEVSIDAGVLLFTVCASLLTALLCGLFPALSASRGNLHEVMKSSGSRTVKGAARHMHRGLMIAEVALTFVLLTGSGLLIRSFLKLQSVDKGFNPSSTVTMRLELDQRYNRPPRQIAFYRSLLDRTAALPGVQAAAAAGRLPLGGGQSLSLYQVEGFPFDEKTDFETRNVTSRYFNALGIPVLYGRAFTDDDADGQPLVAIVSRSFAARYFPGKSALGKKIIFQGGQAGNMTIVGVVADVRQFSLEATPLMQIYTPLWQGGSPGISVVARTALLPDRMASALRSVVRELDPTLAVTDVRTMNQLVSGATAERRFQTLLLTAFGGLALFLSLVGLYALMAYSVQQRTGEIGIRMALGAQPGSVMRLMLKQGWSLALTGIAVGIVCAWAMTRWMAALLFEIKPTDATTFLGVGILFCAVASAACYIPARRGTRVDPTIALRYE